MDPNNLMDNPKVFEGELDKHAYNEKQVIKAGNIYANMPVFEKCLEEGIDPNLIFNREEILIFCKEKGLNPKEFGVELEEQTKNRETLETQVTPKIETDGRDGI